MTREQAPISLMLDMSKHDRLDVNDIPMEHSYVVKDGLTLKIFPGIKGRFAAYKFARKRCPDARIVHVSIHDAGHHERAERRTQRRILREIRAGKFNFVLDEESIDAVSYHSTENVNPRGTPLAIESGFLGHCIEIESESLIDTDGPRGTVYDESVHGNRLATDEECAFMTVSIGGIAEKAFDTRKRMPKPIAAWLRKQARELSERLNAAADQIEQFIDDRDLSLIKRFVAADPDVKFSDRHGLVDSTKPLPEPRWEPRTPIHRKIMGQAAADALENEGRNA